MPSNEYTGNKTNANDTIRSNVSNAKTQRRRPKSIISSKSNFLFFGIALLAFIVAVIVWGLVSKLNHHISEDTTFASNDTQTTITLKPANNTSSVITTRTVYEYDDNNVVGMKTYFEYADNEAAKTAHEAVKTQPEFKNSEVIDKYIVVTADPSQFKGLTADDVQQQTKAIEQFQKSQEKEESTPQPTSEEQYEE